MLDGPRRPVWGGVTTSRIILIDGIHSAIIDHTAVSFSKPQFDIFQKLASKIGKAFSVEMIAPKIREEKTSIASAMSVIDEKIFRTELRAQKKRKAGYYLAWTDQ